MDKHADFGTHISFFLWRIWKHRCDCFFKKLPPDPIRIALSAYQAANEFLAANKITHSPCDQALHLRSISHRSKWIPPSGTVICINTDASWHHDSLSCGVAAVARDCTGSLIAGRAVKLLAPSPMAAEALAIREALYLASSFPNVDIVISSDSQGLIDAIKKRSSVPDWKASTILTQVRYLSSTRHVNWSWISRKANKAAHLVASLVHSRKCPTDWVLQPPSPLVDILLFDVLPDPPSV